MDAKDNLLRLAGMAYDAALDERQWPVFLETFAAALGGCSALLRSADLQNNSAAFISSFGYDPAWQRAYCQHFVKTDYLVRSIYQVPQGTVWSNDQFFAPAEECKTEHYNDYLLPQGKPYAMGCLLSKQPNHTLLFSAQRNRSAGVWGDEQRRLLQHLAPHVARAVQVHRKINSLNAEKAAAQGALNHVRMGVILADGLGTPQYVNPAAEELLLRQEGITCLNHRLVLENPQETALLHRLITNAAGIGRGAATGGDMRITMRGGMSFLHCLVTPVAEEFMQRWSLSAGNSCVAIFLTRPGSMQLPAERLSALYGITPAEARLAAKLAAFCPVEQAAEELGIKVTTARTQLKAIFAKTGVRGQSELLMLLATGTLAQTAAQGN